MLQTTRHRSTPASLKLPWHLAFLHRRSTRPDSSCGDGSNCCGDGSKTKCSLALLKASTISMKGSPDSDGNEVSLDACGHGRTPSFQDFRSGMDQVFLPLGTPKRCSCADVAKTLHHIGQASASVEDLLVSCCKGHGRGEEEEGEAHCSALRMREDFAERQKSPNASAAEALARAKEENCALKQQLHWAWDQLQEEASALMQLRKEKACLECALAQAALAQKRLAHENQLIAENLCKALDSMDGHAIDFGTSKSSENPHRTRFVEVQRKAVHLARRALALEDHLRQACSGEY